MLNKSVVRVSSKCKISAYHKTSMGSIELNSSGKKPNHQNLQNRLNSEETYNYESLEKER